MLAARSREGGWGAVRKPLFESRQLGAWHSVLPSLSLAPPLALGTWMRGRDTCPCVLVSPHFVPPRSCARRNSSTCTYMPGAGGGFRPASHDICCETGGFLGIHDQSFFFLLVVVPHVSVYEYICVLCGESVFVHM